MRYSYFSIFFLITFLLSCSKDDNVQSKPVNTTQQSGKRVVKYIQSTPGSKYPVEFNINYDDKGNVSSYIETSIRDNKNSENRDLFFKYNSLNQIIEFKSDVYNYDKSELDYNEIYTYTYNKDGKISMINEKDIDNGGATDESNTQITYNNDIMRIQNDSDSSFFSEYQMDNLGRIISVLSKSADKVVQDLTFVYDENSNCVSGKGLEFKYGQSKDIAFKVSHYKEIKSPFFNHLFEVSFYDYMDLDINFLPFQGENFIKDIEWSKEGEEGYRKVYDRVFDDEGYMIKVTTKKISEFGNEKIIEIEEYEYN